MNLSSCLILEENFEKKIQDLKNARIWFESEDHNYAHSMIVSDGVLNRIEPIDKFACNAESGRLSFVKYKNICAYDESIDKYNSISGLSFLVSHCLTFNIHDYWTPIIYISFNFYTKSKQIVNKSKNLTLSEDPELDSQVCYLDQKFAFIEKYVTDNSIIFIDGPLLGGNKSHYMINFVKRLHERNIIPIFIVKNSKSSLVIDNIEDFKKKYHSDIHWSYEFLAPGERTNFFQYVDKINSNNSKCFTYLKPFDRASVQRVEVHSETYNNYRKVLDDIMHVIYYLYLCSGSKKNVQIKPIIISEIYARESLKMFPMLKILNQYGVVETMNQRRFGG